ncbi:MAG: transcriptional repressor [Fidelibacterota bacterium]|nr:MAG: transcriptional repressor [Candidatus Neomarinimicrobiota bacterium]
MKIADEHITLFKSALKQASLRITSQRMAILEEILHSDQHRECDDIYSSLRAKHVSVSRATVYRTLDLLEQVGFVRKMDIGDGRFRYENKLKQPHHDHIICLQCGKIVEFIDPHIEQRQATISKDHGFELLRHNHQLFGLCERCRDGETVPSKGTDA